MRYISIVILVLVVAVMPSCRFFGDKGFFGKKARALSAMQAREDSIRVADSIRKVHDHLLSVENAKSDSLRLAEEAKLAKETRYNIIVGSFITPLYAKSMADEYKQMGYNTNILKMEGSSFELVSAESHGNFRTAIRRLNAFRDTVQLEAWLYIKP